MFPKSEKIKDISLVLIIILTGILFLAFFKIRHSMTFMNLDELLWMYRSRFFMDRMLNMDFSNLIQSEQPGIMVMWLAGPFMKIINYDFGAIRDFISDLGKAGIPYNIINDNNGQLYSNYKEISFLFNAPMLAAIFSFLVLLYYFLKKLDFGRWSIVFSLLLIVTTPYYIYFTTPTDKLVGIFSTLSLLSLMVYASRKGGRRFLILSAILCSWAALTKLSALFLAPFSLFVLAVYYRWLHGPDRAIEPFAQNGDLLAGLMLTDRPKTKKLKLCHSEHQRGICSLSHFYKFRFLARARNDSSRTASWKNIIKDYLLWLIAFFATSVIFLPTLFFNPNSVVSFFLKESSERSVIDGGDIFLSLKIMLTYLTDSFILSFNLFIMITFVAYLFLIFQRIKTRTSVSKKMTIFIVYFFSFFVFVTLFGKTYSFRYLVPALIIFQIMAGEGIFEFSGILKEKLKFGKDAVYLWAILFILISQALLIYYSEIVRIENMPSFG